MKIIYGFIPLMLILSFLYSFFGKNSKVDIAALSLSFYDYTANSIDGNATQMTEYKGKKVGVCQGFSFFQFFDKTFFRLIHFYHFLIIGAKMTVFCCF